MFKRFTFIALIGVMVSSMFLGAAPDAYAAARDGVCQSGEFCLYYNSDQQGSVSDFANSIPDYGASQPTCYEFKGAGNGQGLCVKNEAASVWNRTGGAVTVFFNSGYDGPSQTIQAGDKVNLRPEIKNDNASHKFGPSGVARDGVCQSGEFCLYYNSDQQGSVSDFANSIPDYGASQPTCYEFKGAGNGQGLCVKNEAASVWNRTGESVTVFFNSGYDGPSQTIQAGDKVNLRPEIKNDNASHKIGSVSHGDTDLSYALYETSGGRITCGFDGYTTTPGRHEGIDIARGIRSPVHALVEGKVIRIDRGYVGSGGLSTIAVYNEQYNKSILYLHTKPLSGLNVGEHVSRGEQIAIESWRGMSSSGAAHTHVEMRPGYHGYASNSTGDPVLDNPNPYPFWRARGYNIS